MRCIGCGQTIEGEPFWVDDGPYCSPECAEEFAFDGELDEQEGWEEELET